MSTPPLSGPHAPGPPPRREERITRTGWRVVGDAVELLEAAPPGGFLSPGRDEDVLFAAKFLLRPRLGSASPVKPALVALGAAIAHHWKGAPPLTRDRRLTRPPERFHGLEWDVIGEPGAWTGELLWRHPHPVIAGAPCTTHIVLVEQSGTVSFTARVTADGGIASLRGFAGAGQARPQFLVEMNRTLRLVFDGADAEPRTLDDREIDDFVREVLLSDTRDHPVAVLAPLEDGGYVIPPVELAEELLGLAPLYAIMRHPATFRLSDSLGDRRLSCYWGALRIYMAGFSCADGGHEHPLLVGERLIDPVIRADLLGRVGNAAARRVRMPERVAERRARMEGEGRGPHAGAGRSAGLGRGDRGKASKADAPASARAVATPPSPPDTSMPSPMTAGPASPAAEGPTVTAPAGPAPTKTGGRASMATGSGASPAAAGASSPATAAGAPASARQSDAAAASLVVPELAALGGQIASLMELISRLAASNSALIAEVERLRTTTAVRAASTTGLERRIGAMEQLLAQHLTPPEADGDTAVASEAGAPAPGPDDATADDDLESLTIVDVLREAAASHADALLILESAERSAGESPYEDADRVAVILDAMAQVARRRQEGALTTSLREAFRDLGIDYRGGISRHSPRKLRQQHVAFDQDGRSYQCEEHIVLGTSYDPRHCLRIYFTSRAPVEPRFVIAHVGRHLDVLSTT